MLMRVITGKLKPGTWDDFERAYTEVITEVGVIPGLRGRWLAHDAEDPDAGVTISLWDSAAALDAYERSPTLRDTINPRLNPFFTGSYATRRCVVTHTLHVEDGSSRASDAGPTTPPG